jgi:integrase/recombinase XerD
MFDQLFTCPAAVTRYYKGPMLEERLTFLQHLANQRYSQRTLQNIARDLLAIARKLAPANRPRKAMTLVGVRRRIAGQHHRYLLAVRWLRFVGLLQQRSAPVPSWGKKIDAFVEYMEHEVELAAATIHNRRVLVRRFFERLGIQGGSLHEITPLRIDGAFQKLLDSGDYSRNSVQTFADALRAFFRFAEARGWCRNGLAASIQAPRVYSQASLPKGPSWTEVQKLLAMTEGNRPSDIRARPILMLLAIYGLRRGEVSRLRLDDFDWEHEVFRAVSSKTRRVRTYPLTRSVGDAILRYLQEVRPRSSYREVFLSLRPPFRPVYHSLWTIVGKGLKSLGVSLPHCGPHALRHACAARLLATGLSLKEIGDHLGHTVSNSTRIYAKVDLGGLREVADFDMGGVL